MADHSAMKLGKLPAKRTAMPLLSAYARPELMPALSADWSQKCTAPWGMMLNDRLSCCTIAALGHAVQTWTANAGPNEFTPSDQSIEADYEIICEYDPKRPETDRGGVMADVLDSCHHDGLWGCSLDGYGTLRPGIRRDIKLAIQFFGGAYLGLELPVSAQTQEIWDHIEGPNALAGGWGGHAVWAVAYDPDGITVVTWGQLKRMTWPFFDFYCSEGYALLSRAWLTAAWTSPSGVNWESLIDDMGSFNNAVETKPMDIQQNNPGERLDLPQGSNPAPLGPEPHITVTMTAQGVLVDIPNAILKAGAAAAFVWLGQKLHVDATGWGEWIAHAGAAGMLASLVRSVLGSNKATQALIQAAAK